MDLHTRKLGQEGGDAIGFVAADVVADDMDFSPARLTRDDIGRDCVKECIAAFVAQ